MTKPLYEWEPHERLDEFLEKKSDMRLELVAQRLVFGSLTKARLTASRREFTADRPHYECPGSNYYVHETWAPRPVKKLNKERSMSEEKWTTVPDAMVRHTWKPSELCEEDRCSDLAPVAVNPDWYEGNGTPICNECGGDMVYEKTEILVPKLEIHVHGGVAYLPDNLPPWLEMEIIDHDNLECGE